MRQATTTGVVRRGAGGGAGFGREVGERLRVLIVAGIPIGVVVAGLGGRLAMLLLRITSPESVRGVTSDDGFIIGRVTLGGTYSLCGLGAAVGLIGAAAYRWVSPWLIGPQWFKRFTVAAASAAVVGSMLIHPDGVDFTMLRPTWLAVALFVALPAVFSWSMAWAVEAVAVPGSWTSKGHRRWVLPLVLVAAFPPLILPVAFAAAVLVLWVTARLNVNVDAWTRSLWPCTVVRGLWLVVAIAGLLSLIGDLRALA